MGVLTGPALALRELEQAATAGARQAARAGRPVLLAAGFPWWGPDPASVWERLADQDVPAILLQEGSGGLAVCGWGAAAALTGQGEGRWAAAGEAWAALQQASVAVGAGSCPVGRPLALGGFAFHAEPANDPAWRGFPGLLLRVPRLAVVRSGQRSWLLLQAFVVPDADPAKVAAAWQRDLHRLEQAVLAPATAPRPGGRLELMEEDLQAWPGRVEAALQALQPGRLDKLVLATRVRARASRPIPVAGVARALQQAHPESCTFAVPGAGRWFVGATPERLVRLRGNWLQTSALAGSAARGERPEEDQQLAGQLLDSFKQRREHQLVVEAIVEALQPLCADLVVPSRPQVLRLGYVQHLHTPIQGRLRAGVGLLQVLRRLHPTPAVGGLPREAALAWLRAHEGWERGWYAGAVGWVDGQGDGGFWVALRSGLLQGCQALVFAGCGLVAGSDPASEERELWLKLRPMLEAIRQALDPGWDGEPA